MKDLSSQAEEALAAKVARLPVEPGVYQFKNARGKVIYVGKAKSLRTRVRQYFRGGDGRIRIPALVERIRDVDVIVTQNVKDALLLENELIKRHRPTYNVKLRDDKQYLALRLDPRETWARLTTVRKFKKDGADYFGPYTSSASLKEALANLHRLFPLRSCSDGNFRDHARRGRPCIEYEMSRCPGPCCDLADAEAYREQVRGTALFLRGRSRELMDHLQQQMARAAEAERFEDAARFRDRVEAISRTLEQQQIVSGVSIDRDVFGLAREGGEVEVQVLHVREGRVVGADGYDFSSMLLADHEVLSSFLSQYYAHRDAAEAPREVLFDMEIEDGSVLEDWLRERWGRRVRLRRAQRGPARHLVETASRNARLALLERLAARESVESALEEIRSECRLASRPDRIECYDISSLNGTLAVGSRVVFEAGQPIKSAYRRYRIREAAPDDDYDCLREVLSRRLAGAEQEPLPDLLMVDGGRGQLGVVTTALADAGLQAETLAISKERDEESPSLRVKRSGGLKAERLYRSGRSNPIRLSASSKGLLLLQRIRDESHRFAIEFQRELRGKLGLASILEELPGIGPVKRRALLRGLGSLGAIRRAKAEALAALPGITQRDADTIHRFFSAPAESLDEGSVK